MVIAKYRVAVDKIVLELPSGLVSPGEAVTDTALRKLKE